MPTNINTSTSSNYPVDPNSQVGGNGNPTAVLLSLMNQIVGIENEIQTLYKQMTQEQTTVQIETMKSSATAQINSSNNQANGINSQAIGALVGAGITLGSMGVGVLASRGDTSNLQAKENDLKGMQALKAQTSGDLNVGKLTEEQRNEFIKSLPENVQTTRSAMLRGDFSVGAYGDSAKQAVQSLDPVERATFDTKIQEQINSQHSAINNVQTSINNTRQSFNSIGQSAASVSNAFAQTGQAGWTTAQGQEEAQRQVASGIQQMSSSAAESTRQQAIQFASKAEAEISAARQAVQSSTAG